MQSLVVLFRPEDFLYQFLGGHLVPTYADYYHKDHRPHRCLVYLIISHGISSTKIGILESQ